MFRRYTASENMTVVGGTSLNKLTTFLAKVGKTSAADLTEKEQEDLQLELKTDPEEAIEE